MGYGFSASCCRGSVVSDVMLTRYPGSPQRPAPTVCRYHCSRVELFKNYVNNVVGIGLIVRLIFFFILKYPISSFDKMSNRNVNVI